MTRAGYRLIDIANAYVNEKAVGRAMKKSGIARGESQGNRLSNFNEEQIREILSVCEVKPTILRCLILS